MQKSNTISKLLCIIIAVSFIASVAPISNAYAVASPFTDVSYTSDYYTEVTAMSGQGVINGYDDGTFRPENSVTHAEAIKLVCAMAGISYSGYSGKADPWYSDVIAWAKDNGIASSDINPEKAATREQICGYIIAAFKLTASTSTNAFSDTSSKAANVLYDYGVIKGIPNADDTVSFGGTQNVKRCDTCIMLYRLSQKVSKPDWSSSFSLNKSHYSVTKPTAFASFANYVDAWNYMLVNADTEESFQVKLTCTEAELDKLVDTIQNAYYFAMFDYLEYASFLNKWEVGVNYTIDRNRKCSNPTFKLTLSNSEALSKSEVLSEISSFNTTCSQIVTSLYNDGSLKNSMSAKEKAHVLYVYMACHTKYDTSYKFYNGYDAAVRGTAVCQGYTAMYNYLCNLAGVRMEGMTGKIGDVGHAWSRICVDGVWYNIDTTWSDPVPDRANYCDEDWFWVTDSDLKTGSDSRTFDSDTLVYG